MSAAIYLPQIFRIGAGASKELPAVLADLALSKPLIVTDPFIASNGFLKPIQQSLDDTKLAYGVFSNCVPDPTVGSVNEGIAAWNSGDYDCVVGFGGGSSMDTAKAISVLAVNGGEIKDYRAPNPVPKGCPIIAIPTTAGTGSEATKVTVITDTDTQEKIMCMGIGLLPDAALVDYELTLSMPYRLTADTGIDSLCHCMEAYISKKANPFADTFALKGMQAIATHIRKACEEPENKTAREAMMLGATYGGVAFSNSSVTLIHGMSRPIGAFYHVPHGLSNAMLMATVTEFSIGGETSRYADCAKAMGLASSSDNDVVAGKKLIDGLYSLAQDLKVPSPHSFGITEAEYMANLETKAAQAIASGSPNNNPVTPTADEIISLYKKAYSLSV